MKFSSKLYLPALDKTIFINEIEYKDFLTLQKYLINDNNEVLITFFDYLIDKYVDYKGYLSALDKFIILIYQRINSLYPQFEINQNNIQYNLNLNEFIDLLLEYERKAKFPLQRISTESIDYYINLPSKFAYKIRAEFIYDWIHTITIRSEQIMFTRDKINTDILVKTPATIAKQIEVFVDVFEEAFAAIKFPLNNFFTDENIKLSLSNGILLELLKLFLRSNLLEWYNKNHFLLSKGGHSLSDLYTLSPAEVNTYFKMVEEEAERIAGDLDKQKIQS